MKTKLARTKKFVSDHRVGIAVTLTATAMLALQINRAKVWNEFLREHNLFDEFYALEDI